MSQIEIEEIADIENINIEENVVAQDKDQPNQEESIIEIDQYWQQCNSDCRVFAIIVNIANFLFQLKALIAPIEDSK